MERNTPDTDMNIKTDFEDYTNETRALWQAKQKQLHRAMNRSYLVRLFYAIRWKYYSNEIVMGVYDAFLLWAWLGILVAIIFGISIVEVSKPWLTE